MLLKITFVVIYVSANLPLGVNSPQVKKNYYSQKNNENFAEFEGCIAVSTRSVCCCAGNGMREITRYNHVFRSIRKLPPFCFKLIQVKHLDQTRQM